MIVVGMMMITTVVATPSLLSLSLSHLGMFWDQNVTWE